MEPITNLEKLRALTAKLEKAEKCNEFMASSIITVMDNTPVMIFIKNIKGKYLFVNKNFAEAFDIPREVPLNLTDEQIFNENSLQSIRMSDLEVIKSKGPISSTIEIVDKNNITRKFSTLKIPVTVPLDGGEEEQLAVIGICGFANDITNPGD